MKSSYWAIISALFLAEIAATFESAMLYAALPTLIREFGDPITAGWLVTMHMLIGAAAGVLVGRMGDIYGRKRMTLWMLVIATIGSLMSAATDNFGVVLAGRALQGLSVAVIPLSIGIIREAIAKERIPVAVGLMTTGSGVGVAIGLVLGGLIVDNLNWHWLFVVSAILLGLSWVAIKFWVPGKPGIAPKEPVDWVEGLLPAPGIMAMLYGVSQSKALGWSDPWVWGTIAAGALIMAYWARRSLRASEPFVDLRLLGSRNVALANLLTVCLGAGTMQVVLVFSTYTQSPTWTMAGLGLGATVAGLAKLPSNILSFFAGPLSGWLTKTFGDRSTVVAGILLAVVGWIVGTTLPSTLVAIIVILSVISFGTTILNAAIYNVIVGTVPEARTGEAIGTIAVTRGMASAIGAQVIAVLLATATLTDPISGAQLPSPQGFRLTMAWIAGLTAIGGLFALFLSVHRKTMSDTEAAPREQAASEA
ncbi:MFS transporter [Novosphingobium sp. RD2P27]|uniref:MFS transporter n=1 Tax=Novosphingobium kalidii TaxID=3230299 RepID=A0ABV2CWK9_9SPHN